MWKRTRRTLKKRDELKFRAAKIEIADRLVAVDRGEIDRAYCDEAGFTQAHPNRSAWTPVGECPASTAQRGKRLNVVGALLFVGFLGLLMAQVGQPLVVILDNAS